MQTSSEPKARIQKAKGLRIGVFGFGFVGSTIAAVWLRAGASVSAFDVSQERIDTIASGNYQDLEDNIKHAFIEGKDQRRFGVTLDSTKVSQESDIKFISVPVYLREDRKADLSFLKSACETVALGLKQGDMVIICPSVPPGTTRNFVKKILEEKSNLKAGEDFHLIYSPERIYVGRAVEDMESNYPAVISGINESSLAQAELLFQKIASKGVIKMASLEEAEFEKLAEGVYRDVNIALSNELALVCNELGLDYYNVRNAANSQPYSKLHLPGLGVGGACIPIYPLFVSESVQATETRLVDDARKINDSMVDWLVEALVRKFNIGKESRIGILGLAFRGDVADSRLSTTYRLVDNLKELGVGNLLVHDPVIKNDSRLKEKLTSDLLHVLNTSEIIIIATDHNDYKTFDWESLSRNLRKDPLIIDGKGILRNMNPDSPLKVYGLGYGISPNITERNHSDAEK